MQVPREFWKALIVALLSIGLMIGALSISLVVFLPEMAPASTNYLLPSIAPITVISTLPLTFTPEPGLGLATLTANPTFTITVIPGSCSPPSGWGQIFIQDNDTLDRLAERYRISKDQLKTSNCLSSDSLIIGAVFYVPPAPTSTQLTCSKGAAGWVKTYVVKPGDTLYAIASNHYITTGFLRAVNCRTGDLIYTGEVLWVPYVATRAPYSIPSPDSTITPYPTDPLTQTSLPFTGTPEPSETFIP